MKKKLRIQILYIEVLYQNPERTLGNFWRSGEVRARRTTDFERLQKIKILGSRVIDPPSLVSSMPKSKYLRISLNKGRVYHLFVVKILSK